MSIDLNILNNDNLAPRDEVILERVSTKPYPDGKRVRVEIDVTPFRERPNIEIEIAKPSSDHAAQSVAQASILATMNFRMAFTLHLRGIEDTNGDYTVRVTLYYDDIQAPTDQKTLAMSIPPAPDGENSQS